MNRSFTWPALLAAFVALSACAAHAPPAAPRASPKATAPAPEYRIQPGDQLDIKFYFSPELNESVTVRPDGRISLQLVRDVEAAGLTPNALTERLTLLFEKSLLKPEIAVIVRTFSNQRVFVDGEVHKAGVIPLVGTMTVAQAISQAGGMRDTACASSVLVVRRDANAEPVAFAVDISRVFDGSGSSQDVPLQPSDIVFVPKSTIADINQFIDQYVRKNIPILVYLGLPVALP
jgi:polysaccharide export outer membrane protein